MLRWFRIHATRITLATLCALASLGASSVLPHGDDCHDIVCLPMTVEHDADAHRFVAPPTGVDAPHLHCLVCHWLRSFRPQTETRVLFVSGAEAGAVHYIDSFAASLAAPAAQPPLRAPPVAPSL
jgi:hypothetical protein